MLQHSCQNRILLAGGPQAAPLMSVKHLVLVHSACPTSAAIAGEWECNGVGRCGVQQQRPSAEWQTLERAPLTQAALTVACEHLTSNKSSDPLRYSALVWTLLRFFEHSCAGRAACARRCWCLRRPARPASCRRAGEAMAAHTRSASWSRSPARAAAAPASNRRRRPHSPPMLTLQMYRMATRRTRDFPSGAPSSARQRARARACRGAARRRGRRATTPGCRCCATRCTTRRRRGAASAAVRAGPGHRAYVPPTTVFAPQALLHPSGPPWSGAHAGALPRPYPTLKP